MWLQEQNKFLLLQVWVPKICCFVYCMYLTLVKIPFVYVERIMWLRYNIWLYQIKRVKRLNSCPQVYYDISYIYQKKDTKDSLLTFVDTWEAGVGSDVCATVDTINVEVIANAHIYFDIVDDDIVDFMILYRVWCTLYWFELFNFSICVGDGKLLPGFIILVAHSISLIPLH